MTAKIGSGCPNRNILRACVVISLLYGSMGSDESHDDEGGYGRIV